MDGAFFPYHPSPITHHPSPENPTMNNIFSNNKIAGADRTLDGNPIPLMQEPWPFRSDFIRTLLSDVPYSEQSLRAIEFKCSHPAEVEPDVRLFDLNERASARGYADPMPVCMAA
jgi:hypothetical protein